MRIIGMAMLLSASFCCAQSSSDFKPASSNVLDAQYPQVDSNSRVLVRFKAPDATKVKINFWSGEKADMEKQPDGFWTFTTKSMAPGLHYYSAVVDGADVNDPGSTAYFGGSRWASAVEVPEAGADYYLPKDVPHGQVREIWYRSSVTGTWRHALVYLPPDGEAIYETRPWKISAEGPNMVKAGSFQGDSVNKLGEKDIRFTRNKANTVIYAIVLGWPSEPIAYVRSDYRQRQAPVKLGALNLLERM